MSGKGKFSGFSWHYEFHTTEKKKSKAADCIYLTENRICRNKKSIQYLEKCFMATHCPLRVKEKITVNKDEDKPLTVSKPEKKYSNSDRIKSIKCTLPINCPMSHKKYGEGHYVDYDADSMLITVKFGEKLVRFQYPNAILNKYLIVYKNVFDQVMRDVNKAEKG